ncbi:MAG: penicillin-binding protein 1C [Stagnimonas sp.]|nr:penicillin-binding protein 1C [Stagnimonas sp.]
MPAPLRRWLRGIAAVLAVLAAALLLLRLWPHAALRDRIPLSTVVLDRHGAVLRITLASDAQLRLWTPLDQLPQPLIDAVLLHEDQHFFRHPGVNAVALLRAAVTTASGGPTLGASTITMQLARLLQQRNTRSIGGKLAQIGDALWLEARYSKREILEAYLNAAPYGGNLQGVGAAARLYFGKAPRELDLAQTLALAVLPQAPGTRTPRGVEGDSLRAARLRLFARWRAAHPESAAQAALVERPLRFARATPPFEAPHFTTLVLRERAETEQHTTLDLRLQKLLERRLKSHLAVTSREGVNNASVLLLDTRDMGVRAWLGSANFFDARIEGQVDGLLARRSPGSTLKPLLYALAIDQGLIHPLTVLKDAPSYFGPYAPENNDGSFLGPITAHDALIRSRNVPAVQLAARLQSPTLYRFLKNAGVALPKSERHYGLALTLGGGEVSPVELAQLYAMLANRGVFKPLQITANAAVADAPRLLSEEASFMVMDILRDNPRPDEVLWRPSRNRITPAWKTGTSWGFRDAWTAGVIGPYVLVVWMGNFDGRANPALVGLHTAAPLFFDLADALRTADPDMAEPIFSNPPRLAKVQVCAASGDLPNVDCPQRATTWFIPGVSPIKLSEVHRRVRVDTRTGRIACADAPESVVSEAVYEYWPSDLMRLFAQAGIPRRKPPVAGDCRSASPASAVRPPQIVSPIAGVSYVLRPAELGVKTLPLQAHADAATRALYWFADGAYLGSSAPGVAFAYAPSHAGRVQLTVSDERGGSDARALIVRLGE